MGGRFKRPGAGSIFSSPQAAVVSITSLQKCETTSSSDGSTALLGVSTLIFDGQSIQSVQLCIREILTGYKLALHLIVIG
jgi:hypothetical protein